MTVYQTILTQRAAGRKMLAVLLDPDKCQPSDALLEQINAAAPDFVLVGGSRVQGGISPLVCRLKTMLHMPVVLFPGSATQFAPEADALLFLSLISGRNPEWLIGQQVQSAMAIKQSAIEVLPTGYVLVDGGRPTAVERVSGTAPMARDKVSMVVSTAVAGQLLGQKLIYLEAGSGAQMPVPTDMVQQVRMHLSVPLIVGGGLRTEAHLQDAMAAGADLLVVGNYFETHPCQMAHFCQLVHTY